MPDQTLNHALGFVLLTAFCGWVLYAVLRFLHRNRPDLNIGLPVFLGAAGRIVVLTIVGITQAGSSLRGPDEIGYFHQAQLLAHSPFGDAEWIDKAGSHLFLPVMGAQIKLIGPSMDALRVTQILLTMCGLLFIVAAVHDLAGPRASRLASWFVMLEPANLFFASILHKEPLLYLAAGLVCLGGVRVWRTLDAWGLSFLAVGSYIAILDRPYAGYFLLAASVFVVLHASLLQVGRRRTRAIPLLLTTAAVLTLSVGPILHTADKSLPLLRASQADNASNGSNLALEEVSYNSRADLLKNLPRRLFDITFRPYPWHAANTSQQLGVAGSLAALATLFMLLRLLALGGRRSLLRIAPLMYPAAFLYCAYAISSGNSGTSFRYRTTVLAIAMGALAVLIQDAREKRESPVADGVARRGLRWPLLDSTRRPVGSIGR